MGRGGEAFTKGASSVQVEPKCAARTGKDHLGRKYQDFQLMFLECLKIEENLVNGSWPIGRGSSVPAQLRPSVPLNLTSYTQGAHRRAAIPGQCLR